MSAGRSSRVKRLGSLLLAAYDPQTDTWMLTDDLGPWSPLAMGLAGLIPALAVAPRILGIEQDIGDRLVIQTDQPGRPARPR